MVFPQCHFLFCRQELVTGLREVPSCCIHMHKCTPHLTHSPSRKENELRTCCGICFLLCFKVHLLCASCLVSPIFPPMLCFGSVTGPPSDSPFASLLSFSFSFLICNEAAQLPEGQPRISARDQCEGHTDKENCHQILQLHIKCTVHGKDGGRTRRAQGMMWGEGVGRRRLQNG